MSNEISMIIGSSKLVGWKSVSVSRSMDTLCSSFNLSLVDVWEGSSILLVPNLSCKIFIDDTKVLTGYIDTVNIKVEADTHIIDIHGRDKTCDLVDCGIDLSPGSWRDIEVIKLIYAIVQPFGISLVRETNLGEKVKDFTLNSGETPYEAIQRICVDRALLPISNEDGNVVLTCAGNRKSTDKLIYGENVMTADIEYDFANRFSQYKIKAQKSGGGDSWNKSTTEVYGEAFDAGIERYRPKIITADGQMTNSLAAKRAAWEAQTRAGRSGKLTVTIPTWMQSNKILWDVNTFVPCDIPPFRISPDKSLLIHEIEYRQDEDSGTTATLKLIRGDSYLPEPKKTVKKPKSKSSFGGW